MTRRFKVTAKAWKTYSASEPPYFEETGTVRVKGLLDLEHARARAISGFDKWLRIRHKKYRNAVNASLDAELIEEEAN